MKLGFKAENFVEWIAMKLNLAPKPLLETQVAFTAARAIMAGADLGLFEAIGKTSKTADEVANACKTHPQSTAQLLNCLVGVGYLQCSDNRYSLKKIYHKWLLKSSDSNLVEKLRFQIMEWNWVAKLEDYVRSGKPLDIHESATKVEWERYQEGMRDLSINAARELSGKLPMPAGATAMLDIGGSHGLYSIELCKRYPSLSSTILDLPGAIESASAIAKRYDQTGRVKYEAGNALADDLGTARYDLVLINNLVHHFSAEQNRMLAAKVARTLKPGGVYAIGDLIRAEKPGEGGVVASTLSLYFSLTSSSGNWSSTEMSSWQQAAGLVPVKTISLMSLPGWKMVMGKKG
ncbi:MAG: methyltransferase domain-containing protein [Planctomycetia bacterium]|nr:methyltransferase domain-containing protein [Planctomycetia bacterium]